MDGTQKLSAEGAAALAAEIERIVRATPGVRSVYRSGSLISNLLREGAAVLGVQKADQPVVSVLSGEQGVAVEASLGVDFRTPSADTLSAVQEAVDDLLAERGLRRDTLTLTVAYVHPRESS